MPDREKVIKALEDFNKNRICLPHLIPWDEIADAIFLLKEQEAVEAEYEGDARSTWWWVCGECHTTIKEKDKFCKECGRRILWGK